MPKLANSLMGERGILPQGEVTLADLKHAVQELIQDVFHLQMDVQRIMDKLDVDQGPSSNELPF